MSTSVAIGLGLSWLAAAATSLGWLIKSRGARSSARMRHRRPVRSLRVLLTSRWFTVGMMVATVGGLLHIAAIGLAPISTVQAVMATGIVMLGPMAERLFGWPVPARQWTGFGLTALGLVMLTVSLPDLGGAHSSFSGGAILAFDLVLALISALLLLAPRLERMRRHDGVLIGAASGFVFGLADIAVKAAVGVLGHGLVALLLSPWLVLAVLGGLLAQYLSARSLQTGDAVSVTALTGLAVNIANIAGGILVFGDPIAHGLTGRLVEGGAFALICFGAYLTPVRGELATRAVDAGPQEHTLPPWPRAADKPSTASPINDF